MTLSGQRRMAKMLRRMKKQSEYLKRAKRNRLTAGWLVCTEGMERGASYPIYAGRNFVGRDDSMDIILRGDRGICRKRHGAVVYDPRADASLP